MKKPFAIGGLVLIIILFGFVDGSEIIKLKKINSASLGAFAISAPGNGFSGALIKDTIPRIAYWWGKVNQHVDASGNWQTDPDGVSGANLDQLTYCKKWYPSTTSVANYKSETITTWRTAGNTGPYYTATVTTIQCVQNNKLYLIGGTAGAPGQTPFSPIVWSSVSPETGKWSKMTSSLPSDGPAVVFKSKLWLIGGTFTDSAKVYSSTDGITWTLATTAPWTPRIGAKVLVFNDGSGDAIYMIGGHPAGKSGYFTDVQKSYDGITWKTVASQAVPLLYGHGVNMAVVFNNEIWVSDIASPYSLQVSDPHAYTQFWHSKDGVTWIGSSATPPPWANASGGTSGTKDDYMSLVYNNKLWILGGLSLVSNKDVSDVWSFDGTSWTKVVDTSTDWAPREASEATVFNGKMWIFSGWGNPVSPASADSWYSTDGVHWTVVQLSSWVPGLVKASVVAFTPVTLPITPY